MTAPENPDLAIDPRETLRRMDVLATQFYWMCFRAGMGTRCHTFLEFNGLLSKYVDLCHGAVAQGVDISTISEHAGIALPAEDHDIDYLAEKLGCIFKPMFRRRPRLAQRFAQKVTGYRMHSGARCGCGGEK